jgi:hypothetical protein
MSPVRRSETLERRGIAQSGRPGWQVEASGRVHVGRPSGFFWKVLTGPRAIREFSISTSTPERVSLQLLITPALGWSPIYRFHVRDRGWSPGPRKRSEHFPRRACVVLGPLSRTGHSRLPSGGRPQPAARGVSPPLSALRGAGGSGDRCDVPPRGRRRTCLRPFAARAGRRSAARSTRNRLGDSVGRRLPRSARSDSACRRLYGPGEPRSERQRPLFSSL